MKTFLPDKTKTKRVWYEIDAAKFTLGRLATQVAVILRGKHKTSFTPHMDIGDFVVVKNAKQVKLTGRKIIQKEYIRFTGYPGGIRRKLLRDMLEDYPERVILQAVRGMLAPNRLRQPFLRRLKIVAGPEHQFQVDKKIT